MLMTHGRVECETISDDHQCRVVEEMGAPYMIQPERLFGMTQKYTSSFKALDNCNFITISKEEVLLLLETQLVFRLNMLNMLAAPRLAIGTQDAERAHRALLLLQMRLSRRIKIVLHPHETIRQRIKRQPVRHQQGTERDGERRTDKPAQRKDRDSDAGKDADVKSDF